MVVMPGLDPGIQRSLPLAWHRGDLDCRAKPGNDKQEGLPGLGTVQAANGAGREIGLK